MIGRELDNTSSPLELPGGKQESGEGTKMFSEDKVLGMKMIS